MVDIFNGESNEFSEAVSLNCAAALMVADKYNNFNKAYQFSKNHLESGKTFEHLKKIQNG